MLQGETEEVLLEKARFEEKSYNWTKVARLYEQVVQVYLDKKVVEKAAVFTKRLDMLIHVLLINPILQKNI